MAVVVLRRGSRGPYVVQLKERLNARGATLTLTDTFDRATEDAVKDFQRTATAPSGAPLDVDGVVGPNTWAALGGPPTPIRELANPRGYAVVAIALWEAGRGVREEGGNNRGDDVRKYQDATNHGGTGWAWCAAFVTWCYEQAGLFLRDANGFFGVAALKTWAIESGYWRPREAGYIPPSGAIVIYTYSHTGIVVSGGDTSDSTVEGNTGSGNAGSQRDGDGVYRRTRPHGQISGYVVLPEILWQGESGGMCPVLPEPPVPIGQCSL